jgi:Na+/H+ antiporter NhaD/arsenite permease-like protein
MLLIRPLLQTNSERRHVVHTVIFFIFMVSNIGGCLLPIGDPPLFLGYLKGVPFFWTLGLWAPWLVCNAILLIVYFVVDTIAYRNESEAAVKLDLTERQPLRLQGAINIVWLLGVVCSVAFVKTGENFPGLSFTVFPFMRELLMLGFVVLSLVTTPRGVRAYNQFNYAAILEVAALFIGIFITMQVPIAFLNARGAELGVTEPWQYFWATGSLSSFLDNAPTYVVFFETARVLPLEEGTAAVALSGGGAIAEPLLVAISLGAVFLGAMTYIGNGPNFMVKSIAEQTGIPMPSFFGYMLKYSIPFLIPIFIAVTFLFLMPWSPLR